MCEGEVMLQPDFAAALLQEAHNRGINTAIETACNAPWANLEKVLPHVDTMLHDLKLIDYELLPYYRYGLGKYESLGVIYELDDYKTLSDEVVQKFQKIIDEAFGRTGNNL